jgi:HlyD family secretion protein
MDIQRKGVGRKKWIRRVIVLVVIALAIPAITIGLGKLKPAAPGVEFSTLWPDTVKRGPMVLEVHGLGTLVPEDTMLITATTAGRVSKILVRPGISSQVRADTVIMVLTSPEMETTLVGAEYALKAAEADYENLKVTLQKQVFDLQASIQQITADYNTATLQADRDSSLAKEKLIPDIDAKISSVKANQLKGQLDIAQKRLTINQQAEDAQLSAAKVKVEQLRADYSLKKSQVDQLKVRAGFDGTLQALPPPMVAVEEGQNVQIGTPLGKVAQPRHLKAELKIAETQVKDITPGLHADIDTRLAGGGSNGHIEGRVSRIDPSILNGTVTVDVALTGSLPQGARPDLSVDGTIQLQKLDDVVYVGRPVFGQENAPARLFKVEPDGKYATAVKVTFGRSSVSTIEVKEGLKVGDRVILSDMSAYDNYDRIKLN